MSAPRAGGAVEPGVRCSCCCATYAPVLVKRYLGVPMCVECVRGYVGVFARDESYRAALAELLVREEVSGSGEAGAPWVQPPVTWAPGETGIVDDDYAPV